MLIAGLTLVGLVLVALASWGCPGYPPAGCDPEDPHAPEYHDDSERYW